MSYQTVAAAAAMQLLLQRPSLLALGLAAATAMAAPPGGTAAGGSASACVGAGNTGAAVVGGFCPSDIVRPTQEGAAGGVSLVQAKFWSSRAGTFGLVDVSANAKADVPPADPDGGKTCASVWYTMAGSHTCGSRINWLKKQVRLSDRSAKVKVASEFSVCSPCADGGPPPPCELVWDVMASGHTCGTRIGWLKAHEHLDEPTARAQVAGEFDQCRPCGEDLGGFEAATTVTTTTTVSVTVSTRMTIVATAALTTSTAAPETTLPPTTSTTIEVPSSTTLAATTVTTTTTVSATVSTPTTTVATATLTTSTAAPETTLPPTTSTTIDVPSSTTLVTTPPVTETTSVTAVAWIPTRPPSQASLMPMKNGMPTGCTASEPGFHKLSELPKAGCLPFVPRRLYHYPGDFPLHNKVEVCTGPGGERVFFGNTIPPHDVIVEAGRPAPCAVKYKATLPKPQYSRSITEIPSAGPLGLAMDGVPLVSAIWAAFVGHLYNRKTVGFGHPHGPAPHYWHYHYPALGYTFGNSPAAIYPSASTLIGYAMDGFPIFGPLDDSSVLDECNGRFVDGNYQYHARRSEQVDLSAHYCNSNNSAVNNWKYFMGCYHGVLPQHVFEPDDGVRDGLDCSQPA